MATDFFDVRVIQDQQDTDRRWYAEVFYEFAGTVAYRTRYHPDEYAAKQAAREWLSDRAQKRRDVRAGERPGDPKCVICGGVGEFWSDLEPARPCTVVCCCATSAR